VSPSQAGHCYLLWPPRTGRCSDPYQKPSIGRALLVLASSVAVGLSMAACSDTTQPNDSGEPPLATPEVSGIWFYRTTGLAGARFQCTSVFLTLDLNKRSRTDVRGLYQQRSVQCTDSRGFPARMCCTGDSVRGTLTGNNITLDFAPSSRDLIFVSDGVVGIDSMGGTVRITFSYSDSGRVSRHTVRGDWTANRDQ